MQAVLVTGTYTAFVKPSALLGNLHALAVSFDGDASQQASFSVEHSASAVACKSTAMKATTDIMLILTGV
jgi:hypothetical protein